MPSRIFVLVSSASMISASRSVSLSISGAILVSRSSKIVCFHCNCSTVSASDAAVRLSMGTAALSFNRSAIPVSSFVVWARYPGVRFGVAAILPFRLVPTTRERNTNTKELLTYKRLPCGVPFDHCHGTTTFRRWVTIVLEGVYNWLVAS